MRGSAQRAGSITVGRPLPLVLILVLTALAFALPGQSSSSDRYDSPAATIQLCATYTTETCESEITILKDEVKTLDVFLNGAEHASVVAWETHLLQDGAFLELVDATPVGPLPPVQEQGTGLSLDGLERLAEEGSNENTAQYFTAQNRFTRSLSAFGPTIDYTITLLRFDEDNHRQPGHSHPFSGDGHLRIGRIAVQGVAPGTAHISVPAKTPSKSSC